MLNRLKAFFKKEKTPPPQQRTEDEKAAEEWYHHKSRLMEEILGKEHSVVMHAIFPYAIGGGLDLYFFPNGIAGTVIATKELSEFPNQGSSNDSFSCYELVMATRHPLDMENAKDQTTAFGHAFLNINSVLNRVARYSAEAKLNSNDTLEFPDDMPKVGGKCFVLDPLGSRADDTVRNFGLLVIIEIFRSELDFARSENSAALIEKLKLAGHYPYSDLDREPVA